MKKGVCIVLISCCMLGGICFDANAQTLKNYAKQRNQELVERQRMERSNYEKACHKNTLAAYNEYLSMYPKGKYVQDVRKRVVEIESKNEQELYDYATKVDTAQSYEAYLKKYPTGRFAQEARGRLEDMELWKKAKSANTIAAYKNYLNTTKNKSYSQLANEAITDLESIESWEHIHNSLSKSEIESFINRYPKSSRLQEANKRIDELTGVELYEQGNLLRAFEKFESAGGRYSLSDSNRSKYDECKEYVAFKSLNSSSKESELMDFLKRYPSSKYYDQVSNYVAIAKAKNLSMFSNSSDYNESLMYAKDKATRNAVRIYIDDAKKSHSKYKRQQRINRIKENGGLIKYGIEVMDFGYAGLSSSYNQSSLYYNMGFGVKYGNYCSPVQFEMGFKLGFVITRYNVTEYHESYYGDRYSYDVITPKTYFHMPIYAKMKINLCSAGKSKLYIAGIGTYNVVKDSGCENDFSAGGGIGFAWKKWDWFTLYYKQDIQNRALLDNKSLGTSFVYYF